MCNAEKEDSRTVINHYHQQQGGNNMFLEIFLGLFDP